MTPEIESMLTEAMEKAEASNGQSREEIFDRMEETAERIHRQVGGE